MFSRHVVNCFQKLLSSWWRTTIRFAFAFCTLLWIAFKNYYLRDEEQQRTWRRWVCYSCELLSKIIIFVMKNNPVIEIISLRKVVNCFQKLLSSWWRTTFNSNVPSSNALWIAFKNYYLRDEEQQNIQIIR